MSRVGEVSGYATLRAMQLRLLSIGCGIILQPRPGESMLNHRDFATVSHIISLKQKRWLVNQMYSSYMDQVLVQGGSSFEGYLIETRYPKRIHNRS